METQNQQQEENNQPPSEHQHQQQQDHENQEQQPETNQQSQKEEGSENNEPKPEHTPPNQTIYINNLNEKVRLEELRRSLYQMFSQFGPILDIVASKRLAMRGQAFIVFKDINAATAAKKKLNATYFYDKPMNIEFAKTKSDAVAKLEGNYEEHKRKREEEKAKKEKEEPAKKKARKDKPKTTNAERHPTPNRADEAQPNKLLLIERLPLENAENASKVRQQLEELFSKFAGFSDIRVVEAKEVAFAEFENEIQAGHALASLQGFALDGMPIKITYAK